jgi:hypothetical protein
VPGIGDEAGTVGHLGHQAAFSFDGPHDGRIVYPVRVGAFFFGGVEMDDAGPGLPAPTDRRYGQEAMWYAQERMLDLGVLCDRLGYDAFWLTEHHFQYEGYEVMPNAILFGAFLAERTTRVRIGALFNIVPQWHPLRLAEDFALLHNMSGAT